MSRTANLTLAPSPEPTMLVRLLLLMALLTPTVEFFAGDAHKDAVKYAALAAIVGLATFSWLQPLTRSPHTRTIWSAAFPLLLVYLLMSLVGGTPMTADLQTLGSLVMMLAWLTYLSAQDWSQRLLNWLAVTACALLSLHLVAYPILDHTSAYAGLTTQKNFLGSLCLITYVFIRAARSSLATPSTEWVPPKVFYLLPLILLVLSQARGALIAIIVGELASRAWRPLSARAVSAWVLPLLVTSMLAVSYGYTLLGDFDWFQGLQDQVFALTGQNIYSGRNLAWPIVFQMIGEQPWLGYGAGARPNLFLVDENLDVSWSAHSLYLTILIQIGVVGLAALLWLFARLWVAARPRRHDPLVRTAASFFLGVCVYQTFECQLTQNNLDAGIYLWVLPAMMLAGSSPWRARDQGAA